jgi:23S rRNA (cytidine1920-2'-O)/16S rRNA (cytidine1409-2'-O)-methyltransferase
MKLLEYLIATGLAPDERTARSLILRGDVLVNDLPVAHVGYSLRKDDVVRVRGELKSDVSRGARKLRPVMDAAGFECTGMQVLDLGAATGGFTQVALESGARGVYAVDVAYGELATELRSDERVVVMERTNVRHLVPAMFPEALPRVIGDLSFISWRAVLPAVIPLLAPQARLLLLVKPQFELAASGAARELEQGVVRDRAMRKAVLAGLWPVWQDNQLQPRGIYPAGIKGAKGNQEYFVDLSFPAGNISEVDYQKLVDQCMRKDKP